MKIIPFILFFLLVQCASYTDKTLEMKTRFESKDYDQSLQKLGESGIDETGRNRLLYNLESAMILDRMGKGKEARNRWTEADRIVDELYTTSISKSAASFVVNDSIQDYEGEDYEKVAIHTMSALSYLGENKLSEARVEAKAINTRLEQITSTYGDENNNFREDAFARYLSGLIFEAMNNIDDAIIDYRKALSLYESKSFRNFYQGKVPKALVSALYGVASQRNRKDITTDLKTRYNSLLNDKKNLGAVAIIHELGMIASKHNKEFVTAAGKHILRFSYPYIDPPNFIHRGFTGVEIRGKNVERYDADNVEDLTAIAYQCLEDKRFRIIAKSMARLIAKGALTEELNQKFGPWGALAGSIYGAVTETADTRSWTLLPGAFSITRLDLEPGKYDIQIYSEGRINSMKTVEIKAGTLTILRDR